MISGSAVVKRPPFVVFALPRSRTAWLSKFLSYGDWVCGHEDARHLRSVADIKTWLSQPNTGTIETLAAPFWRSLPAGVRVAVVRRPVGEVVDSLMNVGEFDRDTLTALMRKFDRKLDQIEARMNCMSVRFSDLENEETCAALFEHCLPYTHDHDRWQAMAGENIQVDLRGMFRHFDAFRPQLEKLGGLLKQQTLHLMASKPILQRDDLTIQLEDLDTWKAGGVALFADHCNSVGEDADEWERKNWPLWRTLYDAGAMQILTARANGRMFGYLVTFIHPSMTSEAVTSAANTLFFGSDDMPGVGILLQRAALKVLKARGVNDVFWEAGARGSGPKLGNLYKRLGAVEHGKTYRLELN